PLGDATVDVEENTLPADIDPTLTTTGSDPETVTVVDGTTASTNDGYAPIMIDSDGDGVLDSVEIMNGTDPSNPCSYNPEDVTEVQTEPFLSLDCDGDGVPNGDELFPPDGEEPTDPTNPCDFLIADVSLPQSPEWVEGDCDNDNVSNGDELPFGDTDGDGLPNFNDPDDDNDGVDTINEDYGNTNPDNGPFDPTGDDDPTNDDTDGDGIPDYLDVDDDNDGILTMNEGPDPDENGIGFGGDAIDSDGDGLPDYLEVHNYDPNAEDDLEIFNSVTPNGDNDNDVFVIRNIELFPNNTLKIYNRWGVLVYETEGYGQNGEYFRGESNGRVTIQKEEQLPVGTYFYVLDYVVPSSGESKCRAGYLYIQR
ncbi:T9SS type B sorting domain-containing protein, partial [Lacinutrix salivirga]